MKTKLVRFFFCSSVILGFAGLEAGAQDFDNEMPLLMSPLPGTTPLPTTTPAPVTGTAASKKKSGVVRDRVRTSSSSASSTNLQMPPEMVSERKVDRATRMRTINEGTWGVSFEGGPIAFGRTFNFVSTDTPAAGESARRFSPTALEIGLNVDRILHLRGLGNFVVGPSLRMYPIRLADGISSRPDDLWSGGAQASLQFQFIDRQFVIPFIHGEENAVRTQLRAVDATRRFSMVTGYGAGLLLNLNALDSESAAEFYADSGIMRSMLSVEARSYASPDARFSTDHRPNIYASIRIEL